MATVIELRGRAIDGENFAESKQDALSALFHSILDVVDRALSLGQFPDFNPSLVWWNAEDSAMCTLLPQEELVPLEVDQVRLAARAFYRFATGVDPGTTKGDKLAFRSWSKYGGETLARVLEKCLFVSNPKEAITNFHELNKALGRAGAVLRNGADRAPEIISSPRISASGHGLDKVAGMSALKELLRREVVAPVRNPEPYRRYGLSIPNGILLYGPPGCGKTYIARQLAEELGHYFVEIIPSELASPYIHQSVIRIRDLFDAAAAHAPAVVFIDEFEALVPSREGLGGQQQYKAEEVTEFLVHLNSCSEKNIFVIAATNQPERIDSAVRRTGRLDKLIYVGPPDAEARREMLALHLTGRPVVTGLGVEALAEALEFYSASDIRFLVDEAARDALKKGQDISEESFHSAMTRVQPSVTREIEAMHNTIEQRGSAS
jgi:AAA+ superfamily predicted ATPase